MPISSIPAPRSDETSRPAEAILGADMTERLSRASEGDERLIGESAKLLLEAAKILSPSFVGMGCTRSEPTGSTPPTTNQPVRILLKPKAGSAENPPERAVEMAELAAVHEKIRDIRSKLSSLQTLH